MSLHEKFKVFEEDPEVAQFDELVSVNENLDKINSSLQKEKEVFGQKIEQLIAKIDDQKEFKGYFEEKLKELHHFFEDKMERIDVILAEQDFNDLKKVLEKIRGPQGLPGEPGTDGLDGKPGVRGLKGRPGLTGNRGRPGNDGGVGPRGLSAFQVAVEAGFEGTRLAWLKSLVGKQGEPGKIPKHKWVGTRLFFQNPDGEWDKGVDLDVRRNGVLGSGVFTRSGPNFRDNVTPTGTVDGVNTVFVLPSTPISGSEHGYIDGLLQDKTTASETNDYSISGATVTFTTPPQVLPDGRAQKVRFSYRE